MGYTSPRAELVRTKILDQLAAKSPRSTNEIYLLIKDHSREAIAAGLDIMATHVYQRLVAMERAGEVVRVENRWDPGVRAAVFWAPAAVPEPAPEPIPEGAFSAEFERLVAELENGGPPC